MLPLAHTRKYRYSTALKIVVSTCTYTQAVSLELILHHQSNQASTHACAQVATLAFAYPFCKNHAFTHAYVQAALHAVASDYMTAETSTHTSA